ncbi:ubiquitin-like small modifier protein 1 [Methanolobus chelungpuianus]|uniref:Molybdopterin converting factor n=1 Tax=Methanolobus chelungpuianus TaxID=502115 RepID=A0AAE3HAA2_9EURY|nr:ubiquitin-like small modifier protein 1 [Methanolobus chelungpuianus]MCQ6962611.1 molybdopterin converting factor [Methanolobus chelungpuianus]
MAKVKVKLFANLREIAGESSLQLDGNNVQEVLFNLMGQYPALKEMIFERTGDEPKLRGYINVFLNGNNVKHMESLATEVRDGDEIGVFPPVSGG